MVTFERQIDSVLDSDRPTFRNRVTKEDILRSHPESRENRINYIIYLFALS